MQCKSGFTLSSAVGDFVFDEPTIMSHAKLVRDTVMGQVRAGERIPSTGLMPWLKGNLEGPASKTMVRWLPVTERG